MDHLIWWEVDCGCRRRQLLGNEEAGKRGSKSRRYSERRGGEGDEKSIERLEWNGNGVGLRKIADFWMTAWNLKIPYREKMEHERRRTHGVSVAWSSLSFWLLRYSSALLTGDERVGDGEMKWWRQHVEEEAQQTEERNICRKRETHGHAGREQRVRQPQRWCDWRKREMGVGGVRWHKKEAQKLLSSPLGEPMSKQRSKPLKKNQRKDQIRAHIHTSTLSLSHPRTCKDCEILHDYKLANSKLSDFPSLPQPSWSSRPPEATIPWLPGEVSPPWRGQYCSSKGICLGMFTSSYWDLPPPDPKPEGTSQMWHDRVRKIESYIYLFYIYIYMCVSFPSVQVSLLFFWFFWTLLLCWLVPFSVYRLPNSWKFSAP